MSSDRIALSDHFRVGASADTGHNAGELSPGVYRVVGTDADRVTLLEVADGSGDRVHTGRVERVPRAALDGFERVDSPDSSGLFATARNRLRGFALTLRFAPRRLAGRPVQTLLGVALVAADSLGSSVAPGAPESLLTVAGVCGVLLLTAAAIDRP
ncbi:hypothetical protein ACFPYI_10705 [Halomarina salina]|uniref:Uncharacterized protein n=1 Tax=Halomarina salina TaxID=1872699 RepID=A0ABD5RMH0_9EURY|nr:hypothetical protein [Halomarina salina]